MFNPLLSIDRVNSRRAIDELKQLTQDEDVINLIQQHEQFLKKTRPMSKNVFGMCLGLY